MLAHEANHHTLDIEQIVEPTEGPTDVTDGPPAINTGSVTSAMAHSLATSSSSAMDNQSPIAPIPSCLMRSTLSFIA